MSDGLPIIGRDRLLVNGLALKLLSLCKKEGEWTELEATDRGTTFRLRLNEADGTDTHRVVSVTVELEGVIP